MLKVVKMLFKFIFPFFLLLICNQVSWSLKSSTIWCVTPNSSSCEDLAEKTCQDCLSFTNYTDTAATEMASQTVIKFIGGKYELQVQVKLRNLRDIALHNENSSEHSLIKCSNYDAGMVFENITNLSIVGLTFQNCGTLVFLNHVHYIQKKVLCTLAFLYGTSLNLTNVAVTNASTAICILDVQNVSIKYLDLLRAASRTDGPESAGNIIAYTYGHHKPSMVCIEMSNFNNSGSALVSCKNPGIAPSSGGLAMFLQSPYVTIILKDSIFNNNSGCSGGSLLVYLRSITISETETVTIENVTFYNNSAPIGGGAYISFEETFYKPRSDSKSMPHSVALKISNCTFKSNRAHFDGGALYVQWKESISNYTSHVFDAYITDSMFEENTIGTEGNGGLAIHFRTYVESQEEPYLLDRVRVNLYLMRCNMTYHKPPGDRYKQQQLESSVILAKSVPYLRLDSVNISYNNCTAILAIGSFLFFSGNSVVTHNEALTGAGLRLCSDSIIYFLPHTALLISKNNATTVGGGILVNSKCLVNKPMCFFQYTRNITHNNHSLLNSLNVTIKDNWANITGHNLYGGSLDYCYLLYVHSKFNTIFMTHLNITPNTDENSLSISSDPQQVCFVDSTTSECRKEGGTSYIYPGQTVQLYIKIVGQMNGSVPGIVRTSYTKGLALYNKDLTKHISKNEGQHVNYIIFSDTTTIKSDNTMTLYLRVDRSELSASQHSRNFTAAKHYIKFKRCPLGFTMNSTEYKKSIFSCTCHNNYFDHVKNCSLGSVQNYTAVLIKDFSSWIGSEDHQYYDVRHCPLDYCNSFYREIVVSDISLEQNLQCQYNRQGIACGSCRHNYSLILGNNECRKCSNVYLLLIFPFAVAGLVLVVLISCLDLTVTTGSVNGLIFYANIIQLNSIQFFTDHQIPILSPILRLFISWLNLDLGIPVCFFNGMTALTKTFFQVVFPVYLWIIASVIIILSHKYVKITRLVGQNVIKVLATLILLSFTKMLQVTIGSLNRISLHMYNIAKNNSIHKFYWYLDGNVRYFDHHGHMILAILSILFVLVSFPFTLNLLCIKHSYSLSNHWKIFSIINKLKPFFDAYTGPFKYDARFWPGVLLVVRVMLFISKNIIDNKFNTFYYAATLLSLILLVLMIIYNGVYKSKALNILEATFIFNLAFVFMNNIVFTKQNDTNYQIRKVIVNTSLLTAFFTFLGICIVHIYSKFANSKHIHRMMRGFKRVGSFDTPTSNGVRGYEPIAESNEDEFKASSDRMVHFPPKANNSYTISSVNNYY